MRGHSLVTDVTAEPVLKAEIKTHLRIGHTADDDYIDTLATAARQRLEDWTGRAFMTQTWKLLLDEFPSVDHIEIPRPPLQSVTHLKYYDADGDLTTWDSGNYITGTTTIVGRLSLGVNKVWPVSQDRIEAIEVQYVAGYGDASANVPTLLLHAIKFYAGLLYEERVPVVDVALHEIPMSIRTIVKQYQVYTV